jgi:UDP-N-acetylglucosamine 2-epimerase (non-hydrolysing)
MRQRIAIVVGTRPEVIKLAPVYFALKDSPELEPLLLSTGQHREMLDQAFAAFGLLPDVDLGLMQPGQTLPDLTARSINAVTGFLDKYQPAAILVQGDTTTVLASTIAAFYTRVPVGHVEAGLRTYNYDAPWPEEMNRRLTDPISRWCFAPTDRSRSNLIAEGIPPERCHVSGNTVIDAVFWIRQRLRERGVTASQVAKRLCVPEGFTTRFLREPGCRWILVTGHRRESFGGGFEDICRSILRMAEEHPDIGILYPVHLNPNVRKPVNRLLAAHERVALVEPASYEDFIWLMDRCYFVLSDSGGVQEEAPSLGKPVLVMRTTTERPEGLDAGTCRLVGTDPERIAHEANFLLDDESEYQERCALKNPYGDGHAATRIRSLLELEVKGCARAGEVVLNGK